MRALANSMLLRIGISVLGAVGVGLGFVLARHPAVAVMATWATFATLFTVVTWVAIGRLNGRETREHASSNDPSGGAADTVVILASLASVVGVGFLLTGARHSNQSGDSLAAIVGVAGVVASWMAVHTTYALRYARLYYSVGPSKPIDFNSDDGPDYQDFAYLAFTIGMTYQVSDTDITTKGIRRIALRHALVSYVLGAVVLATTINLLVQLASG